MAFINLKPVGSYQAVNGQVQPTAGSYLSDVDQVLKDYYANILALEGGDVEKAKRRLEEDYVQGKRVTMEDWTRGQEATKAEAAAGYRAEDQNVNAENRALEGNLLSRGVSQGGLATKLEGEQVDRQQLRREAIDRALKKGEEDLRYGKERNMEDITKTQTRGTEDLATNFAKFKLQQDQERKEKGLGLAESAYQRDFGKQSTEKSFQMQEESAKKAYGG